MVDAIHAIRDFSIAKTAETVVAQRPNEFGSLVFNDAEQEKRLPKTIYHALRKTITRGEALDPSVADAVAGALKDWAIEHGATHYTHWFQPLTGITAEKHDSFLTPTPNGRNQCV
jgi:glutamine synthetase